MKYTYPINAFFLQIEIVKNYALFDIIINMND